MTKIIKIHRYWTQINRILTGALVSRILRTANEAGDKPEHANRQGFPMWYQVADELSVDGLCFNFLPSWWNRDGSKPEELR